MITKSQNHRILENMATHPEIELSAENMEEFNSFRGLNVITEMWKLSHLPIQIIQDPFLV